MQQLRNEFRRYLWRDISRHRLVALPVVIVAVFWLITQAGRFGSLTGAMIFLSFCFMGAVLWGAYNAANAVHEEYRAGTWDNIRLSAISPWSLTLGKLFGSTCYQWYAALIILLFYGSYAFVLYPPQYVAIEIACMLFALVFSQSLAMLLSVHALGSRRRTDRFAHGGAFIFSIILTGMMTSPLRFYLKRLYVDPTNLMSQSYMSRTTKWFMLDIPSFYLWAIMLGLFTLWCVIGLYRSLRSELKFRSIPWVWGVFVVFCMTFFSGFFATTANVAIEYGRKKVGSLPYPLVYGDSALKVSLLIGVSFVIGLVLFYITLITQPTPVVQYRKLVHHHGQKDWTHFAENLPPWLVAYAIALLAGIWLIVNLLLSYSTAMNLSVIVIAVILFTLRDIGIFHFFRFSPRNSRGSLAAVFYLVMLYGLLPGMLLAMEGKDAITLFYPIFLEPNLFHLFPVAMEVVIVWFFTLRRWKDRQAVK